jgi:DNA replication and repair protein RecF
MKREIDKITNGKESTDINYKSSCYRDNNSDLDSFEKELREKLEQGIENELKIAQCIYGPHRDDVEILLNGLNSRQFCSQGQQRTIALSLILAELQYIEKIKGDLQCTIAKRAIIKLL